jgi:hypothetical protein
MEFISEILADYVTNNSQSEPEILTNLARETHQKSIVA